MTLVTLHDFYTSARCVDNKDWRIIEIKSDSWVPRLKQAGTSSFIDPLDEQGCSGVEPSRGVKDTRCNFNVIRASRTADKGSTISSRAFWVKKKASLGWTGSDPLESTGESFATVSRLCPTEIQPINGDNDPTIVMKFGWAILLRALDDRKK